MRIHKLLSLEQGLLVLGLHRLDLLSLIALDKLSAQGFKNVVELMVTTSQLSVS